MPVSWTFFKKFFQGFGFIPLLYLFAFAFVYLCLFLLRYTDPSEVNLVRWDACFYESIRNDGYIYHWYEASNAAFFPLFPYVWRLLHVEQTGICIFNFIAFFAGLYVLHKTFRVRSLYTLCFISLPSAIFFFLPYTESLFFFLSALILAGLHKNKPWMIVWGLFFCSLSRATSMFFLPAIIFTEVLGAERLANKQSIKNIIFYSLATLAGLAAVVFMQYVQTYQWFAFAKQQTRFWGHRFNWPHLPFVTYREESILWLDGLAFFFGLVALTIIVVYGIKFCLKKTDPLFKRKPFWFSAIYLLTVTLYSIFFNPRSANGSTELISLNRYLFDTAFFFVFLIECLGIFSFNLKSGIFYFLICMVAWIALGLGRPLDFLTALSHNNHRTTIFFLGLTVYTLLVYFMLSKRYANYAGTALFCLNLLLSVHTLSLYIHAKWVG